jgi:ABC-type nitrate/sulfonate/bicarbonate transport system substrate-binding protein
VLERVLRARGIDREDFQLIEIGGWESRYRALLERKITATLLTEPFLTNALAAGCKLLARDFELIPTCQGTCGAASRHWATQHRDQLIRYVRAYVEATKWCFARNNRRSCLDILARNNAIDGLAAERTLDVLLDPVHGLYATASLNLSGISAVLELRADLGYLARPLPSMKKYIDESYYRQAVSISA